MNKSLAKLVFAILIIIAAAISIFIISLHSIQKGLQTYTVNAPSELDYLFRIVNVSSCPVRPLFPYTIYPQKIMEDLYRQQYKMNPKYLLGFYSDSDYAIVLAGQLELRLRRIGENKTCYQYRIELSLENITLVHYSKENRMGYMENLLLKLHIEDSNEIDKLTDGKKIKIIVSRQATITRNVCITKTLWEYSDENTSYGTWFYFIPRKPMAIIIPLLYIKAPQEMQPAAIFIIEHKSDNEALPLQPLKNGSHTEILMRITKNKGRLRIEETDRGAEINYNGEKILVLSLMIPYKLVYNKENVLERIQLNTVTLDYNIANITIMQEENAFLIPPPIIKEIGRSAIIAPYNNPSSMIELALAHEEK